MTVAELIAAERKRQVNVEGWTPEHDDMHVNAELSSAALCYTAHAGHQVSFPDAAPLSVEMYIGPVGRLWPWDAEWFKPSPDPIRNLIKAGALIAAEIDLLQRKTAGKYGVTTYDPETGCRPSSDLNEDGSLRYEVEP